MLQLTKKVQAFILKTYDDGFVTKKTAKGGFSFYLLCWHCRDNGILKADTVDGTNHKKWKLTDKGKQLAELLKQVKILTNGEEVVDGKGKGD
jgi:hypothetical protein